MRLLSLLVVFGLMGCQRTQPPARAFKIQSRTELVGGKRALGEVGDYKISNGIVQAIVQDVGFSRGFGAFGGSLIDVDLVRSGASNSATGVQGNDYFTEMFPAFFLQAIEPSKVDVLDTGAETGTASVRVSGRGAVFVSATKAITDIVIPPQPLDYTCDYVLEPGKQYVKIVVTLTNNNTSAVQFPLTIPFGFVTLLGEGQRLFVPGEAGFDMRFHLEDIYKRKAAIDALPGEVSSMWTTAGDGVSYALVAGRTPDSSYMGNKPDYYPTATPDSLLIPIASSSFLGTFWAKSPTELKAGGSYSYTGYLAVGSGDVASVQNVVYGIKDTVARGKGEFVLRDKLPFGTLSGVVRENHTLKPLAGVSVVLKDSAGNYQSQALTQANGSWSAPVPPGTYQAFAVDRTRSVSSSKADLVVKDGEGLRVDLGLDEPGQLQVVTLDDKGRVLPTKISVEGVYENATGDEPRHVLYDLKLGERFRQSDLTPDDPNDPSTRKYLERVHFLGTGSGVIDIRPGKYKVYASRGIEYDLPSQDVTVEAGKPTFIAFTLKHVMPTPGWVSADFHVHSANSVDSDMGLPARVTSFAVEGVDFLTSTDHNYVTDLAPTIEALNLSDWVRSEIGLELTSLEMGHFNGFPLQIAPGPVQHGVFHWFLTPPGDLFAQLRGLGKDPKNVVVQVNHPRDSILGYFNAFNVGTYVGKPIPPTSSVTLDTSPRPDGSKSPYHPDNFSLDFDAIEVFNGKRLDLISNYRIPTTPIPGPEPMLPGCPDGGPTTFDCLPLPGEVLEKPVKTEIAGQPVTYQNQPYFPGAQDDWFTLLAQGHRSTATGNSDSHSATAEAGLPRTYVQVGDSGDATMRSLNSQAVFDGIRAGKAVPTNGPFILATINGQGPGSTVVAADGRVELKISIKAAPWVDLTRVVVRRGWPGQGKGPITVDTFAVPASQDVDRFEKTATYDGVPDGAFFVVEAFGERSMWPVFTGYEIPSLQISDAVSVIGGSFGFGKKYGKYEPSQSQQVKPYGFTNPIFVNRSARQGLTAAKPVQPVSGSKPFAPREIRDVRKLFHAFHSDPE